MVKILTRICRFPKTQSQISLVLHIIRPLADQWDEGRGGGGGGGGGGEGGHHPFAKENKDMIVQLFFQSV